MNSNDREAKPASGEDPAEVQAPERASAPEESTDPMIRIDVEPPVFAATHEPHAADPLSDSSPPLSRRLAPPPKPRRESGVASRPPPAGPAGELGDPLAFSSALKSPLTPNISYSGLADVAPTSRAAIDAPSSTLANPTSASSSSPPLPPLRSSPAPGEETEITSVMDRAPSERSHGAVDPPPAGALARAVSPSATPPSSTAIFAMRIIAVGDPSHPAPVTSELAADSDPEAYPLRLGTGVRRSSRPKMASVRVPDAPPDGPLALEPPDIPLSARPASLAPEQASRPNSSPLAVALPHDEGAEELSDDDVSPDSQAKEAANAEVDEPERPEAISVPPEELSALQIDAKSDPGKPPPPPKRAAGAPPATPLTPEPGSIGSVAPTPDLAAAKAAQRKSTRAPWWEDLFNEDFMRASSRVSDAQVRREVTFIEDSLGVAAGGVVLDLGCGAGHHAVELASRGYGVVGYDLSLYQLALAADVAQERSQKINFLQGDMREMAFEEMFDGVFCWNTSFGYFEEDKNLAVAQRVFKALRPGGMFLIDVLNRDFAAASAPCTVWYEGDSCVCMDDMSVDYISSRLRVKRSIILDDGRTKESLFSLRLYSLHELGKLLHEVGFRVTEASGHLATPGVFFGPNSPRIIILAQRP